MDATVTDLALGTPPDPSRAGGPGLAAGEMLAGRYRVERFIAAGGIGEVYQAHDALLGESVAMKLLRPEVARKPGAHERFATEIKTARKVTHANVCRVLDVAFDGDRFFYTMELHSGATLASAIKDRAPFTVELAAPLVRQLLDGVAAAHAADIVHQDLKPSNVLLTGKSGDKVLVTDFGLAVPCCSSIGCDCAMPHLIGTPAYMAPEQVTGGTLLDCTDIYAIGVMLFEMMTGTLPWSGPTAHDLAHARLAGPAPRASERRPGVDPRWDDAIAGCLELDMTQRIRSVAQLAAALGV
jgi:eukaryotic-like serine/threonine-protein kinase